MSVPMHEVTYREVTAKDVAAIMEARAADSEWGPADRRTGAYLEGTHHPGHARPPRAMFGAWEGGEVIGYIAGHLTTRFGCAGEVQYLWVGPGHRRGSVASRLLAMLARWFADQGARRVCVDVQPDNAAARAFYRRHGAGDLNPHWLVWEDVEVAAGR